MNTDLRSRAGRPPCRIGRGTGGWRSGRHSRHAGAANDRHYHGSGVQAQRDASQRTHGSGQAGPPHRDLRQADGPRRRVRRRTVKVVVHSVRHMDRLRRHQQGSRSVQGSLAQALPGGPPRRCNLYHLQQGFFSGRGIPVAVPTLRARRFARPGAAHGQKGRACFAAPQETARQDRAIEDGMPDHRRRDALRLEACNRRG